MCCNSFIVTRERMLVRSRRSYEIFLAVALDKELCEWSGHGFEVRRAD